MNVLEVKIKFEGNDYDLTQDHIEEYVKNCIPRNSRLDSWTVEPLEYKDVSGFHRMRWVGDIIATVVIE